MREIKFRGMFNEEKWVYGMYVDGFVVSGVAEATDEYIAMENWCPVDVDTIGQYTGLKDKNGKEIYEGDILKLNNHDGYELYEVKNDCFGFAVRKKARVVNGKMKKCISVLINRAAIENHLEIIGDIHENPELLKEV